MKHFKRNEYFNSIYHKIKQKYVSFYFNLVCIINNNLFYILKKCLVPISGKKLVK